MKCSSAKQGPAFRSTFVSNFMTSFTERARADELKDFAPVYATSGGRIIAERAEEMILINADLKATVASGGRRMDQDAARRRIELIAEAS